MARRALSIISFLGEMIQTYQVRRASRSAAEFAYFLTLSIFPLLICAVAVLASFEMTLAGLFDDLWAEEIVQAVLSYLAHVGEVPSVRILTIAIMLILTASSAAFRAMAKIMADVHGTARYRGLLGFVVSFVFSLLLLFTIYFSVFMIVTGGWLMEEVEAMTGIYGLAAIWQSLRFVVLFTVAVIVVHLIYIFTVPKEPRIRHLPGALLATVALVAGSMIFSLFMGASARYPLIYGSLASFILLMIWCYLCGNILIVGKIFNFVLHRRKERRKE